MRRTPTLEYVVPSSVTVTLSHFFSPADVYAATIAVRSLSGTVIVSVCSRDAVRKPSVTEAPVSVGVAVLVMRSTMPTTPAVTAPAPRTPTPAHVRTLRREGRAGSLGGDVSGVASVVMRSVQRTGLCLTCGRSVRSQPDDVARERDHETGQADRQKGDRSRGGEQLRAARRRGRCW